ncbi:lipase/thioesterase family protein [Metarhizium album ARSEF 1941]|uniref:Lipase/thioesterase family protein n=1 Tax=Metarhizium album (strain ARSEF 1941) TaxID=1081103 RepID=A0A0B2WLH2_METAS|nr:lipase/thioesterase family protein [Metarhizium album ARSEF 1941]KHN94544.1 lipase/thioesterase family protein [Metarhizium album ARSEF 1941]
MAPATTGYPEPTLWQKLDVLPALGSLLASAASALLTGWRRGPDAEPSLYLHVVYAAVRKLVVRLSTPQQQQQAKAFNLPQRTVELDHGAKGHWIGDAGAKHVLVWYHGGGFNLPALSGHLAYFIKLVQARPGNDLAVFFLTYTLAPTATYPTQLRQAVQALRHVVHETRRRPAHVVLGGDSAGGNLVCAVLSHLAHRHDDVDELPLSEPLGAAVMMAPWTALRRGAVQLSPRGGADILDPPALEYWAANYTGSRAPDYYTDPSTAPPDWFRGLPVRSVLVLAGQNEILLPTIDAFVKTLEAGYGPVEFYVAEREAHIAPFVNLTFYHGAPTGQGTKLQSWLDERVASGNDTPHL